MGYEAEVGHDGQHALSLIGERSFDVVLLDVMMPGLDGFEVLKILREHHPATDLPVIMATAKDDSEDVIHALGLGANDYVTKPLDFPVVVARIQTQISLKRAVEQVRQLERRLAERNHDLEVGQLPDVARPPGRREDPGGAPPSVVARRPRAGLRLGVPPLRRAGRRRPRAPSSSTTTGSRSTSWT